MGQTKNPMEKILNIPGLLHLAENIFGNLDHEKLEICGQINQSSKEILANPIFWLRKFEALSKENHTDWIKVIQSVKNTGEEKYIILYLKWNLKKDRLVDLPCYTNLTVQDDFRKRIRESAKNWRSFDEDSEIVQILAPLTENPNARNGSGSTPIHWAAQFGHTEIVKILAPLTANPNAPDNYKQTPIFHAASNGNKEIVKILAPLTDNPNASDNIKQSPIYWAARNGHTEIVKILAPLTDNPNAPNTIDETPIYWAARNRHAEIVKILTPFTNNSRKKVAGLGTLVILCLILLCLYYFSFSIFFY